MIDSNHLISLLEEDDIELQITGLELINTNIEHIWHQVSESIPLIEVLSESDPTKKISEDEKELNNLASIVLSKLYFHLDKLEESLRHALRADNYFTTTSDDDDDNDEYTSTLLHYCIDKYVKLRTKRESKKSYIQTMPKLASSSSSLSASASMLLDDDDDDDNAENNDILTEKRHSKKGNDNIEIEEEDDDDDDENNNILISNDDNNDSDDDDDMPIQEMESIVENIIRRSINEGDESIRLSIGLSIDCRRDDLICELLENGGRIALDYCRQLLMDEMLYMPLEFRIRITKLLEKHYRAGTIAGNSEDCFVLARCLVALGKYKDVADLLIKLTNNEYEKLNINSDNIKKRKTTDSELIALQIAFDLASKESQKFLHKVLEYIKEYLKSKNENKENPQQITTVVDTKYKNLISTLSGNKADNLYLNFLWHSNHSDMYLISYVKMIVESQASVGQSAGNYGVTRDATLAANALMHAGTTVDSFVRKNIDWVAEASYWSTFIATAGLGSIYRGHYSKAFKLLNVYLPKRDDAAAAANNFNKKAQHYYSEGGALYALGLIYAGNGGDTTNYLKEALADATVDRNDSKDMVIHGGCLGLGLAALGTADEGISKTLWDIATRDGSSSYQEAAAIAVGLVNIGTAPPEFADDMLAYARRTPHVRVARSISMALALSNYGRQESADAMIEQMTSDKNPDIRFGGMYAIGLAYYGTSANSVISRLLTAAVSDVSDDVRRASLVALGFVLHKSPHNCPHLVAMLTDSFNPHVRYGAAMALGISCAGTALNEAINLLEPMMNDPVDFVRQGAMIAMAMVLIQTSKAEVPRLEKISRKILDRVTDPREEVMSKMGAILATGIMNAGGRNVTIERNGIKAAAGLAVFSMYWYWFSFIHFLTLAFAPTAVITIDQSLNTVSLKLRSDAPPSVYAYPENMKAADTVSNEQDTPASVLSYGKKKLDISISTSTAASAAKSMEVEEDEKGEKDEEEKKKKEEEEEAEKKKKEAEAKFEILETSCRVTPRQAKVVKFEPNDRYVPIKKSGYFGIVIVKDLDEDMEGDDDDVKKEDEDIIIESEDKKKKGDDNGLKARPEGTRNTAAANADGGNGNNNEVPPPAPFTLNNDDD